MQERRSEVERGDGIETAATDRMAYDGDDSGYNYLDDDGDEVDIPPANKRAEKWRPLRCF